MKRLFILLLLFFQQIYTAQPPCSDRKLAKTMIIILTSFAVPSIQKKAYQLINPEYKNSTNIHFDHQSYDNQSLAVELSALLIGLSVLTQNSTTQAIFIASGTILIAQDLSNFYHRCKVQLPI